MNERTEFFLDRAPIRSWTRGVVFEKEARAQLINLAKLPFIYKWIAVMPDVHRGIGATVGSVIPTIGAIIPAAVGVDIGCGMMAVETNATANDLPSNLKPLREAIEKAVPHGRTDNGGANDRGAWGEPPSTVQKKWSELLLDYCSILGKHPKVAGKRPGIHQLGTLGTGNHFIEVCLDERGHVWIMLHSGSRGPGNKIGTYFIERAKEEMTRWFIHLPDADLAYLPQDSESFRDYVEAVNWAQNYARVNREIMMNATLSAVQTTIPSATIGSVIVNCHHNYVAWENHYGKNVMVTRKGAVRARSGDLGIIPGSMGTRSYIVQGKGNEESFHSCSHGAGRKMSRTQARKQFTVEDHVKATAGVECRKDKDVIDETPAAYKDIDAVMDAQSDLVDIMHTLKQIVCVKG